ncbi:MAG: DUF692 domain-containing protein [Sandaracinaceae bacterium]
MRPAGVGIGLRRPLARDLCASERRVDWLEIIVENFLGKPGPFAAQLAELRERLPIGAHGVSMSLGGPDPFERAFFEDLRTLLEHTGCERHTEHLSLSRIGDYHAHDLISLPYHEDAVRYCAARIREAEDRLGLPVDVENVSTYVRMPGTVLSEGEFVSAVVDEADCGLLLDVNNVFVSAMNHGEDPDALLDALPLERATRIHVAGHLVREGVRIDDHGHPVCPEVLALLARAIRRTGPIPVLLEWDNEIPSLDRVLDEADRVRAVVERALASRADEGRAVA